MHRGGRHAESSPISTPRRSPTSNSVSGRGLDEAILVSRTSSASPAPGVRSCSRLLAAGSHARAPLRWPRAACARRPAGGSSRSGGPLLPSNETFITPVGAPLGSRIVTRPSSRRTGRPPGGGAGLLLLGGLELPAKVKALIWKGKLDVSGSNNLPALGEGEPHTRRIASNLHVAIVTVDLTAAPNPLDPGELYSYNLGFTFDAGGTSDLQGEKLLDFELEGGRMAGVDAGRAAASASRFREGRSPELSRPADEVGEQGTSATDAGLRVAHASLPAPRRRQLRRPRGPRRRGAGRRPAPAPAVPHRRPDLRR